MRIKDENFSDKKIIKMLRIRFVLTALLVLVVMQAVIVSISVAYSYRRMVARADMLIDSIYNEIVNEESESDVDARYFYVITEGPMKELGKENKSVVNNTNDRVIKPLKAYDYYKIVIEKKCDEGFCDGYRYRIIEEENRNIVIFVQRKGMIDEVKRNGITLGVVSVIGIFVMLIFLIVVSRYIVKPILTAYKKQKEFVTSASHELKTPITVILADAEVLGMDIEDNEWIEDIKLQSNKLKDMTNNLVTLAKMDEKGRINKKELFDISELANDVVKSYDSLSILKDKCFTSNIEPGLSLSGNADDIRQLMEIFLDNAFKYSKEKGNISFSVNKLKNHIRIVIKNECEHMDNEIAEKMFERFYRNDSTSAKIAGHGLGLAIARNIVLNHKGKIETRVIENESIEIELLL